MDKTKVARFYRSETRVFDLGVIDIVPILGFRKYFLKYKYVASLTLFHSDVRQSCAI